MREKARKFYIANNYNPWEPEEFIASLAALLSSTAALAREEAAKIADERAKHWHGETYCDPDQCPSCDQKIARMNEADPIASAIRAIGKDG